MMAPAAMLTAATAAGSFFGPDPVLIFTSVGTSLVPDIDTPESKIGRRIPVIPTLINTLLGHRTITHSMLTMLGIFAFLKQYSLQIGIAWLIGFSCHVILDILTPQGVQFFWPIPFNVRLGILQTNGIIELTYVFLLIMFNISTNWGQDLWSKTGQNLLASIPKIIPFQSVWGRLFG